MPRLVFSRRRISGLSLIEIMVGIVLGMLTVIVIMRLFAGTEASKRATTGGDDAQINGTIALYNLERDIRSSGYGFSSYNLLGCTLTYTTGTDSTSVTLAMAPVVVNPATSLVPAGDASTDTLIVFSTNSNGSSEGDALIAASTGSGSGGTYQVTTPSSFSKGDYVVGQLSTRPATCALALDQVTKVPSSGSTLTSAIGFSSFPTGSTLFDLGSAPTVHAYAVRNGNLTVCDYRAYNCGNTGYTSTLNPNVWVPIASNIVSLRAEYGRDTSTPTMTGVLATYDQTTPGSASDTSGLPVYCTWARVVGFRLAVVARGEQYDKTMPTSTSNAPTWAGSTVVSTAPTNPTQVPIVVTGNTNWQYYRYKTLQTVVPTRDMIWSGSQATYQGGSGGC
ncbi:MAG: PilW family protein [Rhodoferax sp.]|nr:PilW family protein [Rhodoferax sp.]